MSYRIAWMGLCVCLGCGNAAKAAVEQAGGAGGNATVNAGAPGLAGGSAGASAEAGGNGEASAGAAGALLTPCGGDVTGDWVTQEAAMPTARPSGVDACWNLSLQRSAAGLGMTGRVVVNYKTLPRTTIVGFTAPAMAAAEGSYVTSELYQGNLVQDFPDQCLADGQGKATCAELSTLLTQIGRNEGVWSSAACNSGTPGGCSCSFQVIAAGGTSGPWSPDPDDATRLVLGRRHVSDNAYDYFKVPYCVTGKTLTFGAELSQVLPGTPPLELERPDCTDGAQGPGEFGVDCGGGCPTPCP